MKEQKRIEWGNFDPLCIVRYVLRHFWMIPVAALIAVMAVYLFFSIAITPSYTSSVTFAVTTKNATGTTVSNVSVTDTVVEQFGEVLSSDLVRDAAAERMGLESFPASVSTSAPESTNILILNVTAVSPELAYKSALALMDSHGEYSRKVFTLAYLDNINGPSVPVNANNHSTRAFLLKVSAPAGAALIILLLVMMSIQADTVQTQEGAKRQVDGKLLTTIYHEKKYSTLKSLIRKRKQALLITNPTCSFYYTETIHQLRVRLEHSHERNGHRIFTVTSCSENEGKSTVAANIALSLAQKHRRVLLVDADLRKPAQNLIFQITPDPKANFGQFLSKGFTGESLRKAIVQQKDTGLYILFTRPLRRKDAESFSAASFRPLLQALRKEFDYIIVDTPPMGMFSDAEVITDASDASILVVRQDMTPAVIINDNIDTLTDSPAEFLGFVLNNVRSFHATVMPAGKYGYGYGYGYGKNYGYGQKKSGRKTVFRKSEKKEEQRHE